MTARSILILAFISMFSLAALATVACPDPLELSQPDGLKFTALAVGDEWNSWTETPEGYTIQRLDNGWWIYAGTLGKSAKPLFVGYDDPAGKVEPHFREAIRPVPEGARETVLPDWTGGMDLDAPVPVNHRILVLLVDFPDRAAVGSTEANWATKVFTDPANSIADYFDEISYGGLAMVPAAESYGTADNGVVGWLRMAYNHPNTKNATGTANQQLTKDAILAADSYVNFAPFDDNGDGYISVSELSVVVIVAGYECAYGGVGVAYEPNVWGHRWGLWSVTPPVCDGKTVGYYPGGYTQMGEWHQTNTTNGHMCTIGIVAHELGHDALGLPDLYDTNGGSAGVGAFCLMGSGNWGRAATSTWSGENPVHLSAWGKYNSGFLSPTTPIRGTYSLPAVAASATAYRLTTTDANQYFLVENRQQTGYDAGLFRYIGTGAGGLAVWHVDRAMSGNTDENHKLVDLEEAEGNCEMDCEVNSGDAQDLYYSGNVTSFWRTTTPNSSLYNGSVTRIGVLNVSASSAIMTAALYPALRSGDVDGDTFTTSVDLMILAGYLGGSQGSLPAGTTAGDLDYDGFVNSIDLDTLIQMLANNL